MPLHFTPLLSGTDLFLLNRAAFEPLQVTPQHRRVPSMLFLSSQCDPERMVFPIPLQGSLKRTGCDQKCGKAASFSLASLVPLRGNKQSVLCTDSSFIFPRSVPRRLSLFFQDVINKRNPPSGPSRSQPIRSHCMLKRGMLLRPPKSEYFEI